MNNHQRRLLLKIIPYIIISFISALIFWILEVGFLSSGQTYPFSDNLYSPGGSFVVIVSSVVFLGTGLGLIEETFFKRKFQAWSYFGKIALKTAIYLTLLLFLLFGQSLALNAIITEKSIFDPSVIDRALTFFSSITLLSIVVYSGFNIALGLLISEIIDYLGLDVVSSFFTGKYNTSVVEERIFMFLDMKDSTSIAEKLGHEMHYEFINTYYGNMTNAIIETNAQIYQYVGDEIVLSWSLQEGLKNANCLQCFSVSKKPFK